MRAWIIDVCRTCDRLAVWPFCEHRKAWLADTGGVGRPSWCVPVRVTTTAKRRRD